MKALLFFLLSLISITVFGQEMASATDNKSSSEEDVNPNRTERLIYGGVGNINFSYIDYGEYYSGGGLGSINIGGLIDIYSTTRQTETQKSSWDNNLRLGYGVVRVEERNDNQFVKSSDDLDYISKFGTPMGNSTKWFYSTALNFQTQLTGTKTPFNEETQEFTQLIGKNGGEFGTTQSNFLAPADLSLGVGIEHKISETSNIFVGPVTGKLRMVFDDEIAKSGLMGNDVTYNADNEVIGFEDTRTELGANVLANYQDKFWEKDRLRISSDLKLFSNYLDKPENIDVEWNTLTSLHPFKYIAVNYTTNVAYDDNKLFTAYANGDEVEGGPTKGIQFKSVFGVGFNYKINEDFKKKEIKTDKLIKEWVDL